MPQIGEKVDVQLAGAGHIENRQPDLTVQIEKKLLEPAAGTGRLDTFTRRFQKRHALRRNGSPGRHGSFASPMKNRAKLFLQRHGLLYS